jgi:drug/metabolite transporter (DMT)-like permease
MNNNKGFFSLLGCGLILALFGLLVRLLNNNIGSFMQVGVRSLIAAVLVFPYFLNKKIELKIYTNNFPLFVVLIVSFPLYIIFFTISVIHTKVANAFFYLFTTSLLTSYFLGYLYFKEKINFQKIVVAVLSIIGLILLAYPFSLDKGPLGILAGILGGSFWGISNATRKYFLGKINNWTIILYQMLTGAAISFIIAFFFKEFQTAHWSFHVFMLLGVFGIGLVVIQALLFIGFKNFKLNLGSIVLASQLIFVQGIGIFIIHEIPTFLEIISSILILIAIVLSNINFNKTTV